MRRDLGTVANPYVELQKAIDAAIERDRQSRAQILPCIVRKQEGWFVDVDLMLDTMKPLPTITNVPVLASRYLYQPIHENDMGLLIPSAVFLDSVMESQTSVDPDITPPNLSGYTFLPLPMTKWTPCGDEDSAILTGYVDEYRVEVSDTYAKVAKKDDTLSLTLSGNDITVVMPGHNVKLSALFSYLTAMQTAYNTNFTQLGKPAFTGTFETP